ncbi:hypothetical protein BGZ72_008840 [Mortierella alpina]|nr:hypothetical protein BGZ72_008840 [Mortierella alpina]
MDRNDGGLSELSLDSRPKHANRIQLRRIILMNTTCIHTTLMVLRQGKDLESAISMHPLLRLMEIRQKAMEIQSDTPIRTTGE